MPRPKLNRDRYPSGQVKPDNSDPVTRIRAIIEIARKSAPILGTPIGRLHFEKVLTAAHVAAADHYLHTRARYDAIMGLPAPNARSPAYGEARAGFSGEPDDRTVMRIRSSWDRLALLHDNKGRDLLHRVIVCGLEPAWSERMPLKAGLELVAASMGYTGPRHLDKSA